MNQIIGLKLSKSDTFYESLLTAFSSENGCVGQGLSDPSVFRQLENDRNSPADCMHNMRASEFALNSCPATPATSAAKSPSCLLLLRLGRSPGPFKTQLSQDVFSEQFKRSLVVLRGTKDGPAVRTWQANSGEHKKAADFAPDSVAFQMLVRG